MPFGLRTWVEDLGAPRESCIRSCPDPTPWEGAILRGKEMSRCKVYGHAAVIRAKVVELTEMPFALWARMGPMNRVLDGNPEVLRD